MKKIIFYLFLLLGITQNHSQNITNTLGTSGLFSIKDGSTTFFSLSQSTGNLTLTTNINFPYSGLSTQGVIYRGGLRFIHDFFNPATYGLNTFVGLNSGNFTMSGSFDQGSYNTALGALTLTSLTIGSYNSAFGTSALSLNSSGNGNCAFGDLSLYANTTGSNNSACGTSSLTSNTTGSYNSAFGSNSLEDNITGGINSAFGWLALGSNTTGIGNSAFGSGSLSYNTTGYPNTAIGTAALNLNTTGRENTAVGYKSLWTNVSGFQNTAVGDSALFYNTGNYNTAIGYNAGSNVTTGANLTLIGIDANPSSPTSVDQITLGNIYVSSLRCNVQTITSLSDIRDKKNITDLTLGLDFITELKPRQFNWDKRDWYEDGISDGSKIQESPTAGFIAQEFDELQNSEHAEWLNLVLKDNPDKWEATYGNLLPIMVKAIQELKSEKDDEIVKLNQKVKFLEQKLNEIKSNENVVQVSNNN